jgi:hypothetical protein
MHRSVVLRPVFAGLVTAGLLLSSVAAQAQTCDPNTEARLQFLESRLDEGAANMKLWWRSWLAVFTIGLVYKTYDGATAGDGSNAAAAYIAAGKSALGIADLTLRPHIARHGAEPMRAIPKTSAQNCADRLALAEKTMQMASDDAGMRWSWKRHLTSFVLNLSAGIAVAEGWDDKRTGWSDFGISEFSSELHIFTHPVRAKDDWGDYQHQFSGAPRAETPSTFDLAATRGGIGFVWRF